MFGKITKVHGSGLIEAQIISSDAPVAMPTTSDGIDNLGDGFTLAPGSTLIVTGTDKQYILGTDNTWSEVTSSGGGGSSGVTQSYVDEHDAAVAAQIPFSATATGTGITLTNSADGYLQGITIKGHSEAVDGEIRSIGDAGWGVVDLGSLTWYVDNEINAFYCQPTNKYVPTTHEERGNIVCANYVSYGGGTQNMPNKSVMSLYDYIYIKDSSYNDTTAFKSAMSGVLLYYPFADATGATPTLGITSKDGAGQGTAVTITTGLPLRSTLDGTVYDELTNDSVITRCEVVNGEVVAKATPVITPLTPTEKTVLASLRTYNPNTQIDVTDSPSMTVNYLLNTDNGQAAAKIDSKIPQVINETVTLAYFRWNGNSAPYTQTVIVPGVLASDKPIIDVSISNNVATGISEAEQWSKITKAVTGNGYITFSCYEEMPGIDLVVNVKVVR